MRSSKFVIVCAIIIMTAVLALTGCSASEAVNQGTASREATAEASAASSPSTFLSSVDLRRRLLTVRDIPVGGWKSIVEMSEEEEEVSKDKEVDDGSVCDGGLPAVVRGVEPGQSVRVPAFSVAA